MDISVWHQHAWRNRLQSLVLLAAMAGFLGLLGWLLWGPTGLLMLVTIGIVGAAFNPAISPRVVMRLYGAEPVSPRQAPALWSTVAQLAAAAGLATAPRVHYVPSSMINAFAVGTREDSALAVTDGLLRRLDMRELAGVMGHEISHIRNNDLWVMGLADLFSRATSLLSLVGQVLVIVNLPLMMMGAVTINWWAILLLVLAPSVSALGQLALSRTREYDADLNAVRLTGDPEGLARALEKIERVQGGLFERIFMPGRRVPDPSLLRTHPETGERIARLRALRRQPGTGPFRRPPPPAGDDWVHGAPPVERPPRWRISGLWH